MLTQDLGFLRFFAKLCLVVLRALQIISSVLIGDSFFNLLSEHWSI